MNRDSAGSGIGARRASVSSKGGGGGKVGLLVFFLLFVDRLREPPSNPKSFLPKRISLSPRETGSSSCRQQVRSGTAGGEARRSSGALPRRDLPPVAVISDDRRIDFFDGGLGDHDLGGSSAGGGYLATTAFAMAGGFLEDGRLGGRLGGHLGVRLLGRLHGQLRGRRSSGILASRWSSWAASRSSSWRLHGRLRGQLRGRLRGIFWSLSTFVDPAVGLVRCWHW